MEAIFIHLIKSSGIALLFIGCYHLFLKKETFFNANRWFLLSGLLVSFVLPFITLTNEVFIASSPIFGTTKNIVPIIATPEQFNWITLLLSIYAIGIVVFIIKMLIQLISIKRLITSTKMVEEGDFYLVNTPKITSPFSFFKYIFYNSSQFDTTELNSVLHHEKVHASEYHSLDILLIELLCIVQWFNPTVWWYKKSIKQNLEFLADAKAYSKTEGKKFYQYLMLKQAVSINSSSIVNPFYNSLIKKRIVMLNQNQSKKSNLFKMLFMLPVLALFLVSFNTETVYVMYPNETTSIAEKEKLIEVIITKDTSDDELLEMKDAMIKEGVDFSYTVVHNNKGEIISISIHIKADKQTSSYNTNSDTPIKTIIIVIDEDKNISIGNASKTVINKHNDNNGSSYSFTISDDAKNKKPLYLVNGKKISNKEFEKLKPDDIESITVLKDEFAIKKYGKKAKNGVIEITTKKK